MNSVDKRNQKLLFFGLATSRAGDEINKVAFSVWAAAITGSASSVAIVYSVQTIARVVFSVILGGFVDSSSRKKLMVRSDVIRAALTALNALALIVLPQEFKVAAFSGIAVLLGMAEAIFSPSISSIVPELFSGDDIRTFNSRKAVVTSMSRIFGLVTATAIVSTLGFFMSFLVNSATFLVSAVAEQQIRYTYVPRGTQRRSIGEYTRSQIATFHLIFREQLFRSTMLVAAIVNFFLAPLTSVIVLFRLRDLAASQPPGDWAVSVGSGLAGALSFFFIAVAIGGIVGASIAPRVRGRLSHGLMAVAVSFLPASLLNVLSIVTGAPSAASAMMTYIAMGLIFGGSLAFFNVMYSTHVQTTIPSGILGRFWSLNYTVVQLAVPVGLMLFGAIQDSAELSVFSMEVAQVGLLLTAAWFYRESGSWTKTSA